MTSGGGTPIDPKASAGKSALTLLKKHLVKLQNAKRPVNQAISECVRRFVQYRLGMAAYHGQRCALKQIP